MKSEAVAVQLNNASLKKGEQVNLEIAGCSFSENAVINYLITDFGELNWSEVLSGSAELNKKGDTYNVVIPTQNLEIGRYRLLSLVVMVEDKLHYQFELKAEQALFFQINKETEDSTTLAKLRSENADRMKKLGQSISEPVILSQGKRHRVFVFIEQLKLGRSYYFDKYWLFPSKDAVGNEHYRLAVEKVLTDYYGRKVELVENSQHSSNHLSIAEFPEIVASSQEEILNHVSPIIQDVINSFSLVRGASGRIFACVIIDLNTGEIHYRRKSSPYKGNLSTGGLAGEKVKHVVNFTEKIRKSNMFRLYAQFYREAIEESNRDFQFFKFAMLLELMGSNCTHEVDDFITPLSKELASLKWQNGSALSSIYSLMTTLGLITEKNSNQKLIEINAWLGFRNSIAHLGGMENFEGIKPKLQIQCCKLALTSRDYSAILDSIKTTAWLALQNLINTSEL